MRIFTLLFFLFVSLPAYGQTLDMSEFKNLPILHDGRIKPINSFAELQKDYISGHKKDALPWLTQTLFDPANAAEQTIFEIKSITLKSQLSLNTDQSVFSYIDLLPGLEKTHTRLLNILEKSEDTMDADEKALLEIHDKAIGYSNLLRSFSSILPLEKDNQNIRFLDLNVSDTTAQTLMNAGQQSTQFKVLPAQWEDGLWLSPWEMLLSGKGSPASAQLLNSWENLSKAYRENDPEKWNAAIADIQNFTKQQSTYNATRLKTENLYRTLQPYLWIIGFYGLSIALGFRNLFKPAIIFSIAGIIVHSASIAVRVYILERPPVGTLYESVLFVSLICAAFGLWFTINKKEPNALIAGNLSALGLLAMSPVLAQGGDSLEVLVAVLNTNFWLATHVLCITIGYGVCILAGTLAHGALISKVFNGTNVIWLKSQQYIYHLSLLALFFTTFGTILGGIWADQSWGRFWGWDPKENGALLIVLWLIWIQHGRLSGHIKPLGFMALMAGLNIIVALAWFGVNLLSVGLHSYGFTSGIAEGLLVFCLAEIILITALTLKIKRQTA